MANKPVFLSLSRSVVMLVGLKDQNECFQPPETTRIRKMIYAIRKKNEVMGMMCSGKTSVMRLLYIQKSETYIGAFIFAFFVHTISRFISSRRTSIFRRAFLKRASIFVLDAKLHWQSFTMYSFLLKTLYIKKKLIEISRKKLLYEFKYYYCINKEGNSIRSSLVI